MHMFNMYIFAQLSSLLHVSAKRFEDLAACFHCVPDIVCVGPPFTSVLYDFDSHSFKMDETIESDNFDSKSRGKQEPVAGRGRRARTCMPRVSAHGECEEESPRALVFVLNEGA